jgi:hypothetical protein
LRKELKIEFRLRIFLEGGGGREIGESELYNVQCIVLIWLFDAMLTMTITLSDSALRIDAENKKVENK